jgi:hypothetical protein
MIRAQGDARVIPFVMVAVAVASLVLPACQKREKPAPANTPANAPPATSAPAVMAVELGNAIQPNKRVTQPSTNFSPTDTIYAAVLTEGNAPAVTLTARWTFEDGQVVDESSQTIVMSGPATTEFHISKPGGWPAGVYKVEVLLNGTVARVAGFTVR